MLRTLPKAYEMPVSQRMMGIAAFTLLTIISARVTVEIGPVPLTLQTLIVFLCGMVLGARDGGLAQLSYVALIAIGLPFDARGLGTAVFAGPTWGYLVGFIPAAYVIGYIVERSGERYWLRIAAGLIGSFIIFGLGFVVLKFNLSLTWWDAFVSGVLEFQGENLAKVLLAAGIAEGMRKLLYRTLLASTESID